tara:strand:+ start:387 stop:608 length:222 start_codon:yes stop_codon:yes gene_type:complete
MNNLYVLNEVLTDYTSGMAVIAAPSLDACREVFADEFEFWTGEFDSSIENGDFKVIEGVDHPTGLISYVHGGG